MSSSYRKTIICSSCRTTYRTIPELRYCKNCGDIEFLFFNKESDDANDKYYRKYYKSQNNDGYIKKSFIVIFTLLAIIIYFTVNYSFCR